MYGRCFVVSCSISDYSSIFDGDSDFCNVWNLICNEEDGCVKVKHDWVYTEEHIHSFGVNKKKCLGSRNTENTLSFF